MSAAEHASSRAEPSDISVAWLGRLVRLVLVFRALTLLITLVLLPSPQRTPVVGLVVIAAALMMYVPLRRWDRIAVSLARHPLYLAGEVLLATLILAAAGVRSSFFFFTLGTAVLAGIIYGRRGAIPFSALLMAAYELVAVEGLPTMHPHLDAQTIGFSPLLYPAAVAAGVAAREMVERGVATEALLHERTEALVGERERLRVARELHDSLAKTVEGLSMTALALPTRCERNPSSAAQLARQLAADAAQAAREARALMSDLRGNPADSLSLGLAISSQAEAFARRSGIGVEVLDPSGGLDRADGMVEPRARHELLRIVGEALVNAERHGQAKRVTLTVRAQDDTLNLSVDDDGCGLDEPLDLERLKAAGHFGLAGMHERARALGAELSVARRRGGGTSVRLRLPGVLSAEDEREPTEAPQGPIRRGLGVGRGVRRAAISDQSLRERES